MISKPFLVLSFVYSDLEDSTVKMYDTVGWSKVFKCERSCSFSSVGIVAKSASYPGNVSISPVNCFGLVRIEYLE